MLYPRPRCERQLSKSALHMLSFICPPRGGNRPEQGRPTSWLHLMLGVFLMSCAGCSPIIASDPSSPAEPEYRPNVASYLRQSFKSVSSSAGDTPTYSDFEVSGARWVHARTGWNWLVCVRFKDRGNNRAYAFYFQEKPVNELPQQTVPGNASQKTSPGAPPGNQKQKSVVQPPQPIPSNPRLTIAEARYAVQTDDCGSQSYLPLDVATGAIGSAGVTVEAPPPQLQPIH
jgi:hypothetical protein